MPRRSPSPRLLVALASAGLALTFLPRGAPAQAPTVRLVAYNIRHGAGMDLQVDLPRIADALRALDADVITLQEVDDGTERTDRVDEAGRLGELLGMRAYFGAHRAYQGGEYGNAVLTRLPVLGVRTHPIPSQPDGRLTVHEVEVAVGPAGRPVSVVSVHLAGSLEDRVAQADSVSIFFADAGHPVVLAGDFNSFRGDPVLGRLGRDWRILDKDGVPLTFPADVPDREIDFVMVRPAGAFDVVAHRVVDERMASDHRPILAVLRVR